MDVPAVGQSLETLSRSGTYRVLVAWFSSPRVAVRTAVRLADTVPGARVGIGRSEDHGAEGPAVALTAEIPSASSSMVTRQLYGLGVAVLWDAGDIDREPAGRPSA
jgi:hypothetical protein